MASRRFLVLGRAERGTKKRHVISNPVDPFGMADVGFAQSPRGLAETVRLAGTGHPPQGVRRSLRLIQGVDEAAG